MTAIRIHPSELAFAFSYSRTLDVIGWGRKPFEPTGGLDHQEDAWYADGAERLRAADRLVDIPEKGMSFTDEITSIVLALADPALVLMAERKVGDGLRRMTVHVAGPTLVGMTRGTDGIFEVTRYADLTAAAAACAGFLGTAITPIEAGTRIETKLDVIAQINAQADAGDTEPAVAQLVELGASAQDAASLVQAMTAPAASGVLSVFYCVDNIAKSVEPFSVMTTDEAQTWILFPPAGLQGPMIIEQSSAPALTARVVVGVAARAKLAA